MNPRNERSCGGRRTWTIYSHTHRISFAHPDDLGHADDDERCSPRSDCIRGSRYGPDYMCVCMRGVRLYVDAEVYVTHTQWDVFMSSRNVGGWSRERRFAQGHFIFALNSFKCSCMCVCVCCVSENVVWLDSPLWRALSKLGNARVQAGRTCRERRVAETRTHARTNAP